MAGIVVVRMLGLVSAATLSSSPSFDMSSIPRVAWWSSSFFDWSGEWDLNPREHPASKAGKENHAPSSPVIL